jgi:hypothetical protein
MTHGDINADEVYADREMLNRLGYGIFDVNFGKSGVGFENVKDFSYVVAQDEDPKLYRRKVFNLIGRYYPNELAKVLWDKFVDHKWVLSERAGHEVSLKEAADDWFENYRHEFLKEWTFSQAQIPERIRNQREPARGMMGIVTSLIMPNLRALLNAGFSVIDIARAAVSEAAMPGHWRKLPRNKPARRRLKFQPRLSPGKRPHLFKFEDDGDRSDAGWQDNTRYFRIQKLLPAAIREGRFYVQLVANLTGHEPKSPEEAQRRWHEILEHKWYMSERAGHDIGIRQAALDYFRRLNLLQEAETGHED